MENLIGTQLGRYQLVETLGESEITFLFKAYDTRLERHVNLKLVRHSNQYSAEFINYFLQEARALAQLSHSNIVRVLDFGQEQGYLFLVTEHVEGQPLAERLGLPMDWQEAAQILLPLADALDYAHEHQVIHRDLNPTNIIINAENQPVLSDFSLARMIEEEETREVTGTNVGLGSPYYMSPEQGKGLPVDYRADIYAMGIIFYEMITGRKPFVAESGMETVIQQVMADPDSPRKYAPDLPPTVEKIILTALKKNPRERFQSMRDFITAVQQAQNASGLQRRSQTRRAPSARVLAGRAALTLAGIVLLGTVASALVMVGVLPNPFPAKPAPTAVAVVPSATLTPPMKATAVSAVEAAQPAKVTETLAPTRTPAPKGPTPTPAVSTPQATMAFPPYPQLIGVPLPTLTTRVDPSNVAQIREVARWGSPQINALRWSSDGRYLIAATSAGVYFYDPANLTPRYYINGKGWLTAVASSADGSAVATGDQTGMIRVWNAYTGEERYALSGHAGSITALDFSPDGKHLLSGSVDRTARLWDLVEGKEMPKLPAHGMKVNAVAFSKDGKLALTSSEDFRTIVSDVATSKQVGDQISSASMVLDMEIAENNQSIALALYNASIEIWDLGTRKKVTTLKDPGEVTQVISISFAPNSRLLAAAGADGMVRIWNTGSGTIQWRLKAANDPEKVDKDLDQVKTVVYSKDGARLASLTKGGTLITWNMYSQEIMQKGSILYSDIKRMALAPDNSVLAYQAQDQTVYTWSIPKAVKLQEFTAVLTRGNPFSADSKLMALVLGDTVGLYPATAGPASLLTTLKGYPETGQVSFLPDGKIVGVSTSRSLMLWSVASGRQLSSDNSKYQDNCQVARAEDGSYLAAGSILGTFLQEPAAQAFCKNSRNPRGLDSAFMPDGKYLAFGLDNNKVDLWTNDEKRSDINFTAGEKKIWAVAFSPDGQLLATGSEDGTIKIWYPTDKTALENGSALMVLDHHSGPVYDLQFSADGTMLFSSSQDGTIQVWGIIQ